MNQARSPLEFLLASEAREKTCSGETGMFLAYCYICQTVTSEPLVKNPTNHRKVLGFITERAAFGNPVYSKIQEKTHKMKIKTLMACSASFHGSCYRKTIHAGNYKRIKEQYYKIHPRKRPPQSKIQPNSHSHVPAVVTKCILCEGRRNNKKNMLFRSSISPEGVVQIKEAISRGVCSKLVVEKLHLNAHDDLTSLVVSCHELCWKKHIGKMLGNIAMKPVKPDDLAVDEFIKYVKDKFTISRLISLALLQRAYANILGKYKLKPIANRKSFKALLKSKLSNIDIRKKRKSSVEMVSLRKSTEPLGEWPSPASVPADGPTSQYTLRPRSLSHRDDEDASTTPAHNLVNTFPDEILLQIFTHLGTEELGRSVLPVCRRWRQVGRDPSLWLHLHLKRDEPSRRKSVLMTLRHSPLLRTLAIATNPDSNAPDVSDIVQSAARNCPLLTSLTAAHRPIMHYTTLRLFQCNCPLVEHINLENFIYDGITVNPTFLLPLLRLQRLRSLVVGHTRFFIGDVTTRAIVEHCKNLERLDIAGFLIRDDTYRHLINTFQNKLLYLSLSPCIWNKAFRFITEMKCLEELRLKIGYHSSVCEQQLSRLRELRNLKTLKIQFVDLSHNIELSLLFREPTFSNLETIEINGYHDDVCDDLINLLGFTMPSLKDLTLTSLVLVTDVGLGKLMHRCRNLIHLKLVEMDSLNGSCLEKHSRNLPHLKTIQVIRCPRISSLVINQLKMKKMLKNVNIMWEPC